MKSDEIYKEYLKVMNEIKKEEDNINKYMDDWVRGIIKNTDFANEVINDAYERLDKLKKLEEKLHQDFNYYDKLEDEKRKADIYLRQKLGEVPTNINITGGVLSSNSNESFLTGVSLDKEQLSNEKNRQLNVIKEKVRNKEISLDEASKLVSDLNKSYKYYFEELEYNEEEKRHM